MVIKRKRKEKRERKEAGRSGGRRERGQEKNKGGRINFRLQRLTGSASFFFFFFKSNLERFNISPDHTRPEILEFYLILISGCHVWEEMVQITSFVSLSKLFNDERNKEKSFYTILRSEHLVRRRKSVLLLFSKERLKRMPPNRAMDSKLLNPGM